MPRLPETEAFIHNWKLWAGPVARFHPPNHLESSDLDWRFFDTVYTVLPLDGRHQDAMYRLQFGLHSSPVGTEAQVGQKESKIEVSLTIDMLSDGFIHFIGRGPEENKLLELRYDHEVAKEHLGETSNYETIVVQFQYQAELLEAQADQYDSLDDARNRFVEYIHHKNEGLGWDLDPEAIFDPDSDGLSGEG